MNQSATHLIACCACLSWSTSAFSHDGDGLLGMHWHATDTLGFVAAVAMAAVAIWLSRNEG